MESAQDRRVPLAMEIGNGDAPEVNSSQIARFFDGKSVFITGAAGFVGTMLLESLLRCCPGLESAYILLREKNGVQPEVRKDINILNKKIFMPLKIDNPKVLAKIRVIPGDLVFPDMGISVKDIEELMENVSIVFHCAAAISFTKPLRYMITQNVVGTQNILKLCRSFRKLEAFVHTSTAYSNCNKLEVIREEVYPLAIHPTEFIEALESSDEVLNALQSQCLPLWPNTYTFSKALAERLVADVATDIPVAIVRPSIVISSWKGAVPGYTEEGGGIIDVSLGIGKGFIRVLYCDEEKIVDIIPVDIVSNTLVSAAWAISTKKVDSPHVVNCTTGELSPCPWGNFIHTLFDMQSEYPLPKMYQKPYLVMRKYKSTYWASSVVNHYAPALCIDFVLMMMNKKPKLTKLYKFYDFAVSYLHYFLTNEWNFECENFKQLMQLQNAKDSEFFPLDIRTYNMQAMIKPLPSGAPFYDWASDKREVKDRVTIAYKRYLVTTMIKWLAIIWFLMLIGFIIMKSMNRSSWTFLTEFSDTL